MTTFISLDISTKNTGYAVFDEHGNLLDSGVISSSSKNYLDRANMMADYVSTVSAKYQVKEACIEELKVLRNQKTLAMLGITQGIIIRELHDTDITFVPPSVWRSLFHIPKKREEAKRKAIEIVKNELHKTVTDDEAEAILLGRYYYKKFLTKGL